MATQRDEWLGLTTEESLEPDVPICDPHLHLWDHPNDRYLAREFLQDAAGGHRVVKTVFVECGHMYRKDGPDEMKPVGQTEWVHDLACRADGGQHGTTAVAAGVVGFADLTLGDSVGPVLEAHLAASNRFRGIRHSSAWDASPAFKSRVNPPRGLLLDPKFREGFACLQGYGLTYDAWLYHTQLMELVDLARAFSGTTIIVDHAGTPLGTGPYAGKRQEVLQEWRRGIAALAKRPSVTMKLGGMGMPRCGFGWHERTAPPGSAELAETIAPYVLWCIEQFGADRCMFESNFPVDRASYSYTVVWNAFKRICHGFSPHDKAALLHDTGARVYRL